MKPDKMWKSSRHDVGEFCTFRLYCMKRIIVGCVTSNAAGVPLPWYSEARRGPEQLVIYIIANKAVISVRILKIADSVMAVRLISGLLLIQLPICQCFFRIILHTPTSTSKQIYNRHIFTTIIIRCWQFTASYIYFLSLSILSYWS